MNKTLAILIFIIFILVLGFYLFKKSPTDKSVNQTVEVATTTKNTTGSSTTTLKSSLTPSQLKALETLGIDPAKLPTKITPVLKACFESKLGRVRIEEIKKGSFPTLEEVIKAKSCLSLGS